MPDDLLAADARHVWHPYAAMPAAAPPLVVTEAAGVRLRLADGRELVDGMSSWWAAIHGYRHPVLDAAVHDQLGRMAHVMFGGLTHEPAVLLATELCALTGMDHVFFADSGSVSVEVAIKMAVQATGRPRLLTILGGYHGDTTGAMSVCDPVGGMHHLFRDVVAEQVFVPRPPAGVGVSPDWLAQVEAAARDPRLGAVIVEPVVQGAGGMRFYDPAYVRELRRVCDEHGLLLVLDEIATGFGRSGTLFAFEHAGVSPDVLCLGKALTGGYLTMAATLCTARVAAMIDGPFMHGPTFMANPLAASVARASLSLLADGSWRDDVTRISAGLTEGLAPLRDAPGVADVRVLGAIGVVQLDHEVDVAAATRATVAEGVWLRPFRDLVYAMPPYVSTADDVDAITRGMRAAVLAGV